MLMAHDQAACRALGRLVATAKARPRKELEADYRENFANPFKAAELGYIDGVISPEETRPRVIQALEMLANKRDTTPPKKHGNIPL